MLPTVRKLNQSQKFQFRMQLMTYLQMLTTTPNVSQPYQAPTVPFYQPHGIHPSMPFQQQQSPSTSFYQPQHPSTSLGQQHQPPSTSFHQLQPPLKRNQPPHQSQQPLSLSSQPQFSPLATNSSDSNLTYIDYHDEDIDDLV